MGPQAPYFVASYHVIGYNYDDVRGTREAAMAQIRQTDKATGIVYMSHFATCPSSDQFRRR